MTLSADTNVFVYAIDDRDPVKQAVALCVYDALVAARQRLGLQVVGEFQNVLRRRFAMPVPVAIHHARKLLKAFPTFAYDDFCVDLALDESAAGRLGYWDALLLAACGRAGVTTLFSEDMQDGCVFAGVQVVNPFAAQGLSDTARELLDGLAP